LIYGYFVFALKIVSFAGFTCSFNTNILYGVSVHAV